MTMLYRALLIIAGACSPDMFMGPRHPTPGSTPDRAPRDDFYQDLGLDFTGMTVADAQAAAIKAGWRGVYEINDDAHCALNTVCSFEPRDWRFNGEIPTLVFHVAPTK